MGLLLALVGLGLAILFLCQYHIYLNRHRGFSPCRLGRTCLMALSIFLLLIADNEENAWLIIIIAVLLLLLIFLLNLSQAGLLHGCLMTFWQALASSIVLLLILMFVMEQNTRVPGKEKDDSE